MQEANSVPSPESSLPPIEPKQSWVNKIANSLITKIVVLVLLLALLGFGGYKAYAYFTNNPQKIWADTSSKMLKVSATHFKLDLSYSEQMPKDNQDSLFGGGDVSFGAKGEGDAVINSDQTDANFDMNTTLSAQLGSLGLTYQLQSKKIGNYLYYKIDGNSLGSLFGGGSSQKSDWAKFDLSDSRSELNALNQVQKNEITDAFKKAKIMKPEKMLGSEQIDGVATWHYSASLDKQELKNYISAVMKTLDEKTDDATTAAIIDKIEFRKLEIWIGKSDHLIHQIEIQSNSPGIISGSLFDAKNKSRDARRVSDIHQIQTALELTYNDNGKYPADLNALKKYYTVPKAPTPADGSCTETNNEYTYQQLNGGQDYKLDFCLGHDAGSLKAGIGEANKTGLKTISPSNAGADLDYLKNVAFTGSINIKLNLSKFNENIKIDPPSGGIVDPLAKTRDARRISDMHQLQTALELFYNDAGGYPKSLDMSGSGLLKCGSSTYMNPIPKDPKGQSYTYIPSGTAIPNTACGVKGWMIVPKYSITFQTEDTSSLGPAGVHTADQDGIR